MIHAIAKFDDVLKEHIETHKQVHYLSPQSQNEMVNVIGSKIREHILERVKKNKYFSLIADGTTDVSHIEQMTLVLRYLYLDETNKKYEIMESFFKFVPIVDKTGLGISEVIDKIN